MCAVGVLYMYTRRHKQKCEGRVFKLKFTRDKCLNNVCLFNLPGKGFRVPFYNGN